MNLSQSQPQVHAVYRPKWTPKRINVLTKTKRKKQRTNNWKYKKYYKQKKNNIIIIIKGNALLTDSSHPSVFADQLTTSGEDDDDRCALLRHSTEPSECNSASGHQTAPKSDCGHCPDAVDLESAHFHQQNNQAASFSVRKTQNFSSCVKWGHRRS